MNLFSDSLWHRVRPSVSAEATALAKPYVAFETLHHELDSKSLLPGVAARRIKALELDDVSHLSPDQLVQRAELLNGLRTIANEPSVQTDARRSLIKSFSELEQPLAALVGAVKKELAAIIAEFAEVEKQFFEEHLLGHEPTQLTAKAKSICDAFVAGTKSYNVTLDGITRHPSGTGLPDFNFHTVSDCYEPAE